MTLSAFTPTLLPSEGSLGDPYLSFWLDDKTPAVFSMEMAEEVVVVPRTAIAPMPNMPSCVQGLLNRRSRVLWTVNLSQLLATHSSQGFRQQYTVIIVRVPLDESTQLNQVTTARTTSEPLLGFLVHDVRGISRLTDDDIQSPLGHFSPELTPYLRGCVLERDEMLMVLDPMAIARSSQLHLH